MGDFNVPPDLLATFDDLKSRLRTLETRQDTTWMPLVLPSAFGGGLVITSPPPGGSWGSDVAAARLTGDTVELRGALQVLQGTDPPLGTTVFTLPIPQMFPASVRVFSINLTDVVYGTVTRYQIDTSGHFTYQSSAMHGPVSLNGIRFAISSS